MLGRDSVSHMRSRSSKVLLSSILPVPLTMKIPPALDMMANCQSHENPRLSCLVMYTHWGEKLTNRPVAILSRR